MKELYSSLSMDGGITFTPSMIAQLPIRQLAFATPTDRRTQLAEKGHRLYLRCLDEGHDCVLEFTAHHLAADETDVIHDLLAFLAQQMIDLNKHKQAEVKRFLNWLEERLEIRPDKDGETGINSLKKKSYIQNYLGDYQKGEPEAAFADFEFWLHDNQGRFGVALSAIKNEIQDEYERSLGVLRPIKGQLETTDALIDKVVYQLYGLTEGEIKLIEYPQFEQTITSAREEVLRDKEIAADLDKAVEAIAAKFEPAAEQYFARVTESDIEARLQSEIAGWDGLPDKVKTFLKTGELLLSQFQAQGLPDFSPVVISFGKAAEMVLNERLLFPFRQSHTEADCENNIFRQFMRGTKTLSLGSFPIVLASSAERKLRAFILKLYPGAERTILDKGKLLALLTQDKIDKYRNSAAHDAVLTVADANEARQWALDILGYV